MRTKPEFKVWKTITLGTGLKTADDFRYALKNGGFRVDNWANNLLGRPAFKPAAKKQKVDLVAVSLAELGFPYGATRETIHNRARKLGLDLCPAEVGPQLRLQYKDQPKEEPLVIGMKAITDSDGIFVVFDVYRDDDGLWLDNVYINPDDNFWHGTYRWVFRRK